jgi:hypothetical protein
MLSALGGYVDLTPSEPTPIILDGGKILPGAPAQTEAAPAQVGQRVTSGQAPATPLPELNMG